MDDALLLVQVPDALRHLEDDVPRELLGEVGKLDDLVEELAAGHEPARGSERESAREERRRHQRGSETGRTRG